MSITVSNPTKLYGGYRHQGEEKLTEVVVRRMKDADPVFAGDACFLADNTDHVTKFALPSPFLIAIPYWHPDYRREAYPTMRHLLDHLAQLTACEAQAVAASGIDDRANRRSRTDLFLRSGSTRREHP